MTGAMRLSRPSPSFPHPPPQGYTTAGIRRRDIGAPFRAAFRQFCFDGSFC
ncbi:MAG: hypothetical protein ACR2P4_09405 [Gammaproteobacteria bacterium]